MRALFLGALLLAACDNTIIEDTGPQPAPFYPTGVEIDVSYRGSSVVSLSVSGAVAASNRKFGPYSVSAKAVPSGGSIGLLFDERDAGGGMVCVSSIENDGTVKDTDCTSLQIIPTKVTHADVQLN